MNKQREIYEKLAERICPFSGEKYRSNYGWVTEGNKTEYKMISNYTGWSCLSCGYCNRTAKSMRCDYAYDVLKLLSDNDVFVVTKDGVEPLLRLE